MRFFVSLFLTLLACNSAHAWSLKTHLWIAQQVLDDLSRSDGYGVRCTIRLPLKNGTVKSLKVSDEVCNALLNNPEAYRAGHLGPDVFPDPISGQTTTHPGVEKGWSTERWLRQVFHNASTPSELSLAYGFVGHAAGDIFAHTYVNQYAGDIFLLDDRETRVELRHFTLEKYIEARTPPQGPGGALLDIGASTVNVSSRFLSSNLIFSNDAARQYSKVPSAVHLLTMNTAKNAIDDLTGMVDGVADLIIDTGAEYAKLQAPLLGDLNRLLIQLKIAKGALKFTEDGLQVAEKLLEEQEKAIEAAEKAIKDATDFLSKVPSLIEIQFRIAEEASIALGNLNSELVKLESKLLSLRNRIGGIRCRIEERVCRKVTRIACLGGLIPLCEDILEEVCEIREKFDPECGILNEAINRLAGEVVDLQQKIGNETSRRAAALAEHGRLATEKIRQAGLIAETEQLLLQLRLPREAQVKIVEESKRAVVEAQKVVSKAEIEVEKAKERLKPIEHLINQVADVAKKFDPVKLLTRNWRDGVLKSGDDFITASRDAGFAMARGEGNMMEPYVRWFHCSVAAYAGVPWQFPNAYCSVEDELQKLLAEIDEFKKSLPPLLRFLLDPTERIREEAVRIAKKEVWQAAAKASDFAFGEPTGRFILMLGNQERATADALKDVFSTAQNSAGKKLLTIPNVVELVNQDIGLLGPYLDPDRFLALRNAVALAKLSLLDASELNKMYREMTHNAASVYPGGADIYADQVGQRFSLLFYAVKSIDGNHQWQPFGLPYPRDGAAAAPVSGKHREHGHSVFHNPFAGFRIFADGAGRRDVFEQIFLGPIDGGMGTILSALRPSYPFPACAENPFPQTVDFKGNELQADLTCLKKQQVVRRAARFSAMSDAPLRPRKRRDLIVPSDTRQGPRLVRQTTKRPRPSLAPRQPTQKQHTPDPLCNFLQESFDLGIATCKDVSVHYSRQN